MLKGSKKPVKTELPLVVNTPGWVKGELTFSISLFYHIIWASLLQTCISCLLDTTVNFMLPCSSCPGIGHDILVDGLKYIAPTHVVKINISAEGKNLPSGAFWLDEDHKESVNLIEVSSAR